jgi:hypothetical protein
MFRLLLRPSSRCHKRKAIKKNIVCILVWHPDDDDDDDDDDEDDDDDDEDDDRSERNTSANSNIDIDIFVKCNWVDTRWQ